jgi:hypothetical protein
VIIFHDTQGEKHTDIFNYWREKNPVAFFINRKSQSDLMLHRASCDHLDFKEDEEVSLTRSMKICSTNRETLESWAQSNSQGRLSYCNDCKPI